MTTGAGYTFNTIKSFLSADQMKRFADLREENVAKGKAFWLVISDEEREILRDNGYNTSAMRSYAAIVEAVEFLTTPKG